MTLIVHKRVETMNKHSDLNQYYALLGADQNSSHYDLRHFRNKRLLEINDPSHAADWNEIDKRTQAIQRAYWMLTQKTG